MKKIQRIFVLTVLVCVVVSVATGCIIKKTPTQSASIENEQVTITKDDIFDRYSAVVTGEIVNDGEKSILGVEIEYGFYNEQGGVLESAKDIVAGPLAVGERAIFTCRQLIFDKGAVPVSAKLIRMTLH
ncbi:MAG: FxLYD domain-containing protein [Firmicutes bacterium]|nr:FxLYD domain-containing protein [Bacillota bacterium]